MRRYKVGLVGCGAISRNYAIGARDVFGGSYEIAAAADIAPERARALAEEFNIPRYGTPDIVYGDPDIDIVLNLTVPMAHEEVSMKAIAAGKHVYSEKPLAPTAAAAKRIIDAAAKADVRVACAPDSFLSAPSQSAKKLIEDDWIGKPLAVLAQCTMRGNEFWREDPDFFYKEGGGPMLDMGFYYFNVFISLFGPVESVQGMQKITYPERIVKVGARRGTRIQVEVPTYYAMNFKFRSGVIGTFINTMDTWASSAPFIEVYGQKGTMVIPDPNNYGGDVMVKRRNEPYRPMPLLVEYAAYRRGIGIADLARSIEEGRPHRASAEMAYHILDVFESLETACREHRDVEITSTVTAPAGLYEDDESELW